MISDKDLEKKQTKLWLSKEQERLHRLNKNHDKIKKYIANGISLKQLRKIYGNWAVKEVLTYHE